MLSKRIEDLDVGTKLLLKGKNQSVTIYKKGIFRVILVGPGSVKRGDNLHLVLYTRHAIYTWRTKALRVRGGLIEVRGSEVNHARINNRQSPRVHIKNKAVNVYDMNGELVEKGIGRIINVSELGLRFKTNANLECNKIYYLKFTLDISRNVKSEVLYKLDGNVYGAKFCKPIPQLAEYVKDIQIEKIRERRRLR